MQSDKLGQLYSIFQDNKQIIKLGGIVTSIALFLCGYLQNLVINGSILLYLSYSSFKVLGAFHNHPTEIEILVLLLKKWILFACLMIFENMAGYLLKIPFIGLGYNIGKILFLMLLLQNSEHLTTVYDLVGQGFKTYEDKLDHYIDFAETQAQQFRIDHHKEINQYNIYGYFNSVVQYLPWVQQDKSLQKKME